MNFSRPFSAKTLVPLVAIAALAAYYFAFDPTDAQQPFLKCPLHILTGWQCPFCGSQRALHCLLHADLQGAWHYNALFTAATPLILLYIASKLLLCTISENSETSEVSESSRISSFHHFLTKTHTILTHRIALTAYLLLTTLWGIIRNIINI